MKKLTFVLAVLVSVAVVGCKKKGEGGSDCASLGGAVDRMMEAEKPKADAPPEAKKMAEEMMKTMVPKMKAAMIKSCTDDKWPAEAIKCMTGAKNEGEFKGCEGKLSPDQKSKVEKAMMEAMGMGGMGGGKDEPPPPPPTEGSGSAAPAPTEGSAAPAGSGG